MNLAQYISKVRQLKACLYLNDEFIMEIQPISYGVDIAYEIGSARPQPFFEENVPATD